MKQFYPVRHPPVPPEARRGETTPAREDAPSGGEQFRQQDHASPALPHERDESRRSQASRSDEQPRIGEKAWRDATSASQDTDRGPVLDQVYNDEVAPDRGTGPPRE